MLDFIRSVIESKYKTKMVMIEEGFMDFIIRVDFSLCDIHLVYRLDKNLFNAEFEKDLNIGMMHADRLEAVLCRAIDYEILKAFKKE